MTKPIGPDEVVDAKVAAIPSLVIEAFNYMIARNWNGRASDFKLSDVCDLIRQKMGKPDSVVESSWLDVEPIYRAEGWVVEYESPVGYGGENFAPHYTFSRQRK